jgi:hypothetical protein
MMEALSSSKMWVLTRATRRNIPEDGILHDHRRENLNSYIHNTTFRKLDLFRVRFEVFTAVGHLDRVQVTANVVPSSPSLVTLMMEALNYSEMSVLTRATRRNIPEDGILHGHRREILSSYIDNTTFRKLDLFRVRFEVFTAVGHLDRLLVTANVVPSSPILVTLMMEALNYSEMSVHTRATRRNIPEDGILDLFPSSSQKMETPACCIP